MGKRGTSARAAHRLAALITLALGWAVSLWVYVTAVPVDEDANVYDLTHSKAYLRQLEVIGGKAAVLGTELTNGFENLWHGRELAGTLAALTALLALGVWLWPRLFPPNTVGE